MRVQATLANPDRRLLPGMFVNARVVLPPVADVVSVPETAVDHTLYGDSVFIVAEDGKDARGQAEAQGGADLRRDRRRRSTVGVAIVRGVPAGDVVVARASSSCRTASPVIVAADGACRRPRQPPVE